MSERSDLLARGVTLVNEFCAANTISPPRVEVSQDPTTFDTCAYYRSGVIYIWPPACAAIGRAGRAWSYPGHSVDRTPYGVVAHELGHHVDKAHGAAGGIYGTNYRTETGEKPLTGYCPNDNEYFAELFRLFVTNPDLLRLLRPKTYALMIARWRVAERRSWDAVLAGADRQIAVLRKRIPESLFT